MTDRTIASRPSLNQIVAIVDFMEKHPSLALGKLRGLEGRDRGKKLWYQLTRIVNSISGGPQRPTKSWIKFWADKKSAVRAKVQADGGVTNLSSNIEKKIWDLFLAPCESPNKTSKKRRSSVKQETYLEDSYLDESMDQNHVDPDPVLTFGDPVMDAEDRQVAIMEKLVKVMSDQAAAMTQLAHASHANSQAIERLADASHLQARALDRLATTFESIGAATHDVRNAIVDIDTTMKRFYSTSPT